MLMSSDNILHRQTEAHTHGMAKSLVSVNVRPHYPKVDVGSPAGLTVDSSWQYPAVVGNRIGERKSKRQRKRERERVKLLHLISQR